MMFNQLRHPSFQNITRHGMSGMLRFSQLVSSRKLLRDHTSNGKHCKATIVEFFGLHDFQCLWSLRLQVEGVKAQIAWDVALLHCPPIALTGFSKRWDRRSPFNEANGDDDRLPKRLQRSLLESNVRRGVYVSS